MVVGAEKQGTGVYSYKGDNRITKVGRFIRATSIDELPQLFNILKGEMSFIGPRPALTYHPWTIAKYDEGQGRDVVWNGHENLFFHYFQGSH